MTILRALTLAAVLACIVAGSSAQAATYSVAVEFPDDMRADQQPLVLDLEDQGRPQTATSQDGTSVAVFAQRAMQGRILMAMVNVIDHVDTREKEGTGVGTTYLALDRPETLRSPAGARVVLTLRQIHP